MKENLPSQNTFNYTTIVGLLTTCSKMFQKYLVRNHVWYSLNMYGMENQLSMESAKYHILDKH